MNTTSSSQNSLLKSPISSLFLKTFAAIGIAFVLAVLCLSFILKPEVKDKGVVIHISVNLIQDMLNASLRGKDLNTIRSFLANANDEFLNSAQIALISDLFSPQAPQKYGIVLKESELLRILDGDAFWTGKLPSNLTKPDPNLPIRNLILSNPPTDAERQTGRLPEYYTNTDTSCLHDPMRCRASAEASGMFNRQSACIAWMKRNQSWMSNGENGGAFTIYSLIRYTTTILDTNKIGYSGSFRRTPHIVIPIEGTPYVVFSRRLPPLPPEIPTKSLALAALSMLFIVFITALFLIRPVITRIRKIEDVCQKVTNGNYSARCMDKRCDSLGVLSRNVDEMTASIERHFAQQKSLLQAVSHELRTPLSRIRFAIEMLDISEDDERSMTRLDSIDEDLTEIDNLIKELGYFNYVDAGNGRQHFETASVRDMLEATIHQRSHDVENFKILTDGIQDDMVLEVDPAAFKRVIGNLLGNAARYAKEFIQIHVAYTADNKCIEVSVADDGPGIPEDQRSSIFEPFVCLEASRSKSMTGCGLGLAIAHRIMKIHDGSICVLDSDLGGANMVTTWPITHE